MVSSLKASFMALLLCLHTHLGCGCRWQDRKRGPLLVQSISPPTARALPLRIGTSARPIGSLTAKLHQPAGRPEGGWQLLALRRDVRVMSAIEGNPDVWQAAPMR
jgi:hypothetical protein